MHYTSMDQVKRANQNVGHHWFDRDSMRGFRSRVGDNVYGGHYFISSEQFASVFSNRVDARAYTVRYANSNGTIDTIGEFNSYESYGAAKRAIDGYLKQERENGHAVVTCTSCKGAGVETLYNYKGEPEGERVCWRCKGAKVTEIRDRTGAEDEGN